MIRIDIAKKILDDASTYMNTSLQEPDKIFRKDNTRAFSASVLLTDQIVIAVDFNHVFYVYDLNTSNLIKTMEGPNRKYISAMKKVSSHQILAGGDDKIIRLWDTENLLCSQEYRGHNDSVQCISNLSDSSFVSGSADSTLQIWDLASGSCLSRLLGHKDTIYDVVKLSNEQIASIASDHSLRIWDPKSGSAPIKIFKMQQFHPFSLLELSNGQIACGGGTMERLYIWDIVSGKSKVIPLAHMMTTRALLELPDKNILVANGRSLQIVNPLTGDWKSIREEAHSETIMSVKMINKKQIITASKDATLKLWSFAETEDMSPRDSAFKMDETISLKSCIQPTHPATDLINTLYDQFPIDYSVSKFKVFPFCNEQGYLSIIEKIQEMPPLVTDKLKVAILVGESNYQSILPEMNFDLVLFIDIEPKLHLHNAHLYHCMRSSKSRAEFIQLYPVNNPLENYEFKNSDSSFIFNKIYLTKFIKGSVMETFNPGPAWLKQFHFLRSEKRFQECKDALMRTAFCQIELDLTNSRKCLQLANLLNYYGALVTYCNFTNIDQYCDHQKLYFSSQALLKHSPNSWVLYSTVEGNELQAHLSLGLNDYLKLLGKDELDKKFYKSARTIQFWYRKMHPRSCIEPSPSINLDV